MKQGWEIKKLGEVCDFVRGPFGGSLTKNCFKESGYPVYEQQNAIYSKFSFRYFVDEDKFNEMKKFKVNAGDLIMSCSGTLGKVAIVPDGAPVGIINQALLKLSIKSKQLDLNYLYKYMESPMFFDLIINGAQGAAIKNVASVQTLKALNIPIPSILEQERIVGILDSAFAKIEALRANAQQNLKNTKELFQASLKQELTPKQGWDQMCIENVCTLKSGNSDANNSDAGELPYVKVSDMNIDGNETYITVSSSYVDKTKNERGVFPIGTTIFPKRGGAIATNKKRITAVEICCDLNIMGVIPSKVIFPMYLYYFFQGVDLGQLYDGASIPQINNKDIHPLIIGTPIINEQQAIVSKLDSLSARCRAMEENYRQTTAHCNALKQALLTKAFNGEL